MATRNALLVTPYPEFGNIVSQSLGNEAATSVKVATTVSSAQALLQKNTQFHFALLDLELGVEHVVEQGLLLRSKFPSIELILISRKDPPTQVEALRPWKLLRKPFRPRELAVLFGQGQSGIDDTDVIDLDPREERNALPSWLGQSERTRETLASAVSSLHVQEAILFSNQDILAQTGTLPVDAVEEFSNIVRRVLSDKNTLEIIKPVHLNSASKNLLMLTSIMAIGIILAVAYDEDTPYNLVRSQTRRLTQVLKNPQLTLTELPALPETLAEPPQPAVPLPDLTMQSGSSPADLGSSEHLRKVWQYRRELLSPPAEVEGQASSPVIGRAQDNDQHPATQALTASLLSRLGGEKSIPGTGNASKTQVQQPVDGEDTPKAETRKSSYSLSPTEPGVLGVDYACLLVPRMKTHHLSGDLASFLKTELSNLFLAHGWRLEALQIEDSFLHWLTRISPTLAPYNHIKIVRMHTSQRILTSFARLEHSQLLQDFWAPGYLLGAGKQLLLPDEIEDFIQANRKQYYSEDTAAGLVDKSARIAH